LSRRRAKTAQQLSAQVTEAMQSLGMDGGCFNIQVSASETKALSVDGSRMDKGIFGKLKKALGIKTKQKGWELKWAK